MFLSFLKLLKISWCPKDGTCVHVTYTEEKTARDCVKSKILTLECINTVKQLSKEEKGGVAEMIYGSDVNFISGFYSY